MTDLADKAQSLFERIRSLDAEQQQRWLDEQCGNDAELRSAVEGLLDGGATSVAPFRQPVDEDPTLAQPRTEMKRLAHAGPYRLAHELGRGGMGVVYLGMREGDQFRRRVAVKVLKRGTDTDEVLRRFELERQVLSALNHPGIARLFDVGETIDGLPYYVIEYIDGQPIDVYCDTHRLTIVERLQLFRDVCRAVHHAHQNLIVHRDLKPANILVTPDGQPKLLDFGIAKLLNPDMAMAAGDPTAPELRVMTPDYASPEQVRGDPISTASDVYSLGVLLYELVTGHRPYRIERSVRTEMERVICEVDPDKPSTAISRIDQIGPDERASGTRGGTSSITPEHVSRHRETHPHRLRKRLAGDIDNIILMAMRKEPQRRYESAEQFAEDIRRHIDGMPVIARPDTWTYRAGKFIRRNRLATGAAAAVVLSLAAGAAVASNGWVVAADQRDLAEQEKQRILELSNLLIRDVHDGIKQLNGAIELRDEVLTRGISYLDTIAGEMSDDPNVRRLVAAGYSRIGDLYGGGLRGANLGDIGNAATSYTRAHELRSELAAASPDDVELQHELAISMSQLGDIALRRGEVTSAIERYEAVRDLRQQIVARAPTPAYRGRLATALHDLGAARFRLGDVDGTTHAYREALDELQLVVAQPMNDGAAAKARKRLSSAHLRLAGHRSRVGDEDGALHHYGEALSIRQARYDREPDNGQAIRDLAVAHYFVGKTQMELDALDDAARSARHCDALTRRRLDDLDDIRTREDRLMPLELLGRLALRRGDHDEAATHFEAMHAITDELVAHEPEEDKYLGYRVEALGNRARALEATGNRAPALGLYDIAIGYAGELRRSAPNDTRWPIMEAKLQTRAGHAQLADGHLDDARRRFSAARTTLTEQHEQSPALVTVRRPLVSCLTGLVAIALQSDRPADALRFVGQAILVNGAPTPDLLHLRARALLADGNHQGAMRDARDALKLLDAGAPADDRAALRAALNQMLAPS